MIIKKLDKIVLLPFIKLFSLVFVATVFILLMQFFLIYFDELIGKDLGFWIYLQFFFYFGINVSPNAFALATLVSSLMVFGNLGEQLELTALKNAGITFLQTLRPLLICISFLSLFVYYSSGYLVPRVTIKAYTLLYDLRKKKPSIAIKEGVFYNGIPGYSIRVGKKLADQTTLQDIIIYDHTENRGNVHMITAASGELTNSPDGQYFIIHLFQGFHYMEHTPDDRKKTPKKEHEIEIADFFRIRFDVQKMIIPLDDFKLNRTSEKFFTYSPVSKTNRELHKSMQEMRTKMQNKQQEVMDRFQKHYQFAELDKKTAATHQAESIPTKNVVAQRSLALPINDGNACFVLTSGDCTFPESITSEPDEVAEEADSAPHLWLRDLDHHADKEAIIRKTLQQAQNFKNQISSEVNQLVTVNTELKKFEFEGSTRLACVVACLIMLCIGAPLGALIKKGGFGVPLLISTVFMLLYHVINMFGTKWNRVGLISPDLGAWSGNIVLMPFAIFFLWQAQKDTHLLDIDGYRIRWRTKKIRDSDNAEEEVTILEG